MTTDWGDYTPGPWRVRRAPLDPDHPDVPPACYGITAGRQTWHNNKGHFHPEDSRYAVDELHVVEIGYDRDYGTPEAAIPGEADAVLIAKAYLIPRLEAALSDVLSRFDSDTDRAYRALLAELRAP